MIERTALAGPVTDLQVAGGSLPLAEVGDVVVDALERRGLACPRDRAGEVVVELTPAGARIAEAGLDDRPRDRRELLSEVELELLHRLLWDTSRIVANEQRRYRTKGVKWIMHEHLDVDTRNGPGPHNKVRKDTLRRLEGIGVIEPIGGGDEKRTGSLWVVNPAQVQYPW